MAWWQEAVFYQIYPRSFADSNGDGVGDLAGVTARLDYVRDLGVDAIWLSPFQQSPQDDFGYDVSDYRAVDPLFGTLADFDTLLAAAHARGLRVIMDQVISHTSDRHAWFAQSRLDRANPRADWYVWADPKPDGTPPNNWLSVFGGPAWQWEARREQYYLHNFLTSQPDLNLHNPATLDAVLAELAFWLDRGVDGFRLDTANFYLHDKQLRDNPPRPVAERGLKEIPSSNPYGWQLHHYDRSRPENLDVLRALRRLTDRYPERMMVGEIACDLGVVRIAEYCASPDLLHTGYSFDLLGGRLSAAHIRCAVELFFAQPGQGWPAWAMSNHDVTRVVTRWGDGSAPCAKLLLALLLCLPGTPFVYQGEELGLPEAEVPREDLRDPYGIAFWPEFKGRDGCRTPMPWSREDGLSNVRPWLPIPQAHLSRAVSAQTGDADSVLAFARAFLAFRRAHPALRRGTARFLDAPEPVLAFERNTDGERLLCVFNLGPRPAAWNCSLSAERVLESPLTGHFAQGEAQLPPWSGLVAALGQVMPP